MIDLIRKSATLTAVCVASLATGIVAGIVICKHGPIDPNVLSALSDVLAGLTDGLLKIGAFMVLAGAAGLAVKRRRTRRQDRRRPAVRPLSSRPEVQT